MVDVTAVVNSQYPHLLYKRTSEGEAVQDEHGGWSASPGTWAKFSSCREEPNGKGTTIATAGGKFTTFSSAVYIPQSVTERITEGTEVIIAESELDTTKLDDSQYIKDLVNKGTVRLTGTCLKYDRGRLHSRLWV